jgi:hypothetical protein
MFISTSKIGIFKIELEDSVNFSRSVDVRLPIFLRGDLTIYVFENCSLSTGKLL